MNDDAHQKLEILQSLYRADLLNPFPYEDCRKLVVESGDMFADLAPSLDSYFSDIAGLCSWGKRSLKWSDEEIERNESILNKSFFDKFPVFHDLATSINEKQTPTLFNQLLIYDLMRLTLRDILAELKTVKIIKNKQSVELSLAS